MDYIFFTYSISRYFQSFKFDGLNHTEEYELKIKENDLKFINYVVLQIIINPHCKDSLTYFLLYICYSYSNVIFLILISILTIILINSYYHYKFYKCENFKLIFDFQNVCF